MFKNTTELNAKRQCEFSKRIFIIFSIVIGCLFLGIGAMFNIYVSKDDAFLNTVVWIVFILATPFLVVITYQRMKKSIAKTMKNNPLIGDGVDVEFIFSSEEISISSVRAGEVVGTSRLKYGDLFKVVRHNNNLYLYITNAQAFILAAEGMQEGDFNSLIEFLKQNIPANKFKIRKGI